jgi:hypothetical protein
MQRLRATAGDWTLDWFDDSGELVTLKSADGHGVLTAEPEVTEHHLHRDDEFLLMGCDGLWGVFGNQRAVEWARLRLQVHNDPQACAEELVGGCFALPTMFVYLRPASFLINGFIGAISKEFATTSLFEITNDTGERRETYFGAL